MASIVRAALKFFNRHGRKDHKVLLFEPENPTATPKLEDILQDSPELTKLGET
jgi:hypothetical protein